MVRQLFELYATDEYSMKQLEILFWEKGYRNHNGKKIAHSTMSGMISNPKYKGYYVGNKVKVWICSPKNRNSSRRKNGSCSRMKREKSYRLSFPKNCGSRLMPYFAGEARM